jgi:hypothetical protein
MVLRGVGVGCAGQTTRQGPQDLVGVRLANGTDGANLPPLRTQAKAAATFHVK